MKTTEWFPIEMTPARHGAFETQTQSDMADAESGRNVYRFFNWWDGEKWAGSGVTPEQASKAYLAGCGTAAKIIRWRGVTEQSA
ncbi:hypothetical protein [Paraburkholderia fungorum]|uniref:hypothetical protein n=1 Tax=Paraburkholderia fungorum TaxID=134537 RepID=UPI000D058709|nr:hypothetical protein [Paraburkholderia fungorum]PRZ56160.1 hypothetical protein BX589_102361 [Paraburkholderia fungorum]